MAILRYENLTHAELSALPRDRTVVFIPSGPLEQHGPHLPLGVDAFEASFFSLKMAEKIAQKRADWNFILFPTLFAGCDTLTYTGTIEVRQSVIRDLLYDCCKHLAKAGFKTIIAVGAHGGPRHMVLLEELAAKMRWRHRTRMISASSRILFEILEGKFVDKLAVELERTGSPLTAEEREGLKYDFHGGLLETSIMMAAHPELVKPMYKELRPAIMNGLFKLRRNSGKTVGEGLGHLGSPALARPEIGTATAEVLTNDLLPLIEQFLDGQNVYKHFRSKLYYVPFFRTHFKTFILIFIWSVGMGFGLIYMNQILAEMFK